MSVRDTVSLLLSMTILYAAAVPAEPLLTPFDAVYTIRISVVRGESDVSLSRDAEGIYVYDSFTRPKGFIGMLVRGDIRETSRFRIEDGRIVPLHYERVDTISADQRDLVLEFDWGRGVAVSRFADTAEEVELTADSIDPGLLPLVVKFDLANGATPGPYRLLERGKIELIDVQSEGQETVDTRAGDFAAAVFSHAAPEEGRTTRIWAAQDLDHLMVKMAQYSGDKERARLTLKSITFAD